MEFLKNFFQGGEESILRRFNTIIELAMKANREILFVPKTKDISKVRDIEKNSDEVVFNIANLITSGGVAPNLIDDLLQLADLEDSIVDSLYNLSRELVRYTTKNAVARTKLAEAFSKSNELSARALELMHKMQSSDSVSEIKGLRSEIERIEEKGDEIKDALFDFAYGSEIDFKTFYHVFEVAHLLDDVLDNCEDSADMYLTVISSLLT
ncbi:MAG: DUF47 domain-containing protein [Candidatus Micrarchaeia archaeon]